MALLTLKEAAAELGISTSQLTRLCNRGEIAFVNVGLGQQRPYRRFEPEGIEEFKRSRRTITAQPPDIRPRKQGRLQQLGPPSRSLADIRKDVGG